MRRISKLFLLLLVVGFCLTACEKTELSQEGTEISQKETNSLLQVRTRTTATGEVSYPVNVYVFSGEKCVALQTISDAEQMLSIQLTEGSYVVYAVGGATAENYILPSQENATPSMAIMLQEGKKHTDLMVAQSNVVLVDGGTNVLTLAMERKVMMLQSVVLKNIPLAATEVSITISPLWEKVVGTSYEGTSGTETIALTKQEDGRTWSFSGSYYLLPSSANAATMTVNMVKSTETTSYTYNASETLEAGDKLNIQGTYTEAVGVTLTGTIDGAVWNEEKTISFEFNESGSNTAEEGDEGGNTGDTEGDGDGGNGGNTGDATQVTTIPAVGDTYQGCYVIDVSESNGVADVLILSPNQKTMDFTGSETADQAMSMVEASMSNCTVDGITGWRLMTYEEAQKLSQRYKDFKKINITSDASHRLLIKKDGVLKAATIGTANVSVSQSFAATNILRPVTIVKLQKE